jgi:hypothetical protein
MFVKRAKLLIEFVKFILLSQKKGISNDGFCNDQSDFTLSPIFLYYFTNSIGIFQ